MCKICEERKEKFQNATGISERQTAYNEYDKQRKQCAKEIGKPVVAPKPQIKKEKRSKPEKVDTPFQKLPRHKPKK